MEKKVYPAQRYQYGQLRSLGTAAYMLIRQFQFPNEYDDKLDQRIEADSDRCLMIDYENTSRCFNEHTGAGGGGLESWLQTAKDADVIVFLTDILKADKTINWTGYRVLGTVDRSNGYVVWSFELFAKHPESATEVYTGCKAPNVR